ncbi:MAG: heavy metal translocating P-type ATPase, partial [Fimbriimonadaceae bacterium]
MSCCATESACCGAGGSSTRQARGPWFRILFSALLLLAAVLAPRLVPTAQQATPLLSIAAALVGGWPTLRQAVRSLLAREVGVSTLMAIAVVGAAALGDWVEAATVILLFEVAELLEKLAGDRVRRNIAGLFEELPDTATVQRDGQWIDVGIGNVGTGEVVRLRPGERAAFDASVLRGEASFDESPVTGESTPRVKGPGDEVLAGSLNLDGDLELQVLRPASESAYSRIVRMVSESQSRRSNVQRFVDRFARWYTPTVVGLAALVATVPPVFFGEDPKVWAYRALVSLVIACPCALVISTPATILSGIASLARRGVLVKGGAPLERAASVQAVAFDKTGTLTDGELRLAGIRPHTEVAEEELLEIAASLNEPSTHPIANALRAAFDGAPQPVEAFRTHPGRGVSGAIQGVPHAAGNHRMLPDSEPVCAHGVSAGRTKVFVLREDTVLGCLDFEDRLRPEAPEAIDRLRRQKVAAALLSGDSEAAAARVSQTLPLVESHASLLPEDKHRLLRSLRARYGPVAMVGDGINDAPALAEADLAVAMGPGGTALAAETADVVLLRPDLRLVPELIATARRTLRILRQSFLFAVGTK